MKSQQLGLIGVVVLMMIPASAQAQDISDNLKRLVRKVGIHGNMSVRHPVDADVSKGTTFGASIGLSPGRSNGWKYPVGLTMFSENLHSPNGAPLAVMSSKVIMGGIGYGWHFGKLATGVTLQTGYAFNNGHIQGDMPLALDVPNEFVSIDVGNAVIVRPQVQSEYFITPKFTFRASADYIRMRPDVLVTTPAGPLANRWNASNVHANVGIGFYPFRR
jgi:hypothetical protein